MESLARQGPVVVALEDVHWADPSTRELAEDLLELADQLPLLIVATLRPERASEGWGLRMRVLADYPHRAAELPLRPLRDERRGCAPDAAAAQRRARRVGLVQLIVRRAEGNPLYLEELLNAFPDNTAAGAGSRGRRRSRRRGS